VSIAESDDWLLTRRLFHHDTLIAPLSATTMTFFITQVLNSLQLSVIFLTPLRSALRTPETTIVHTLHKRLVCWSKTSSQCHTHAVLVA